MRYNNKLLLSIFLVGILFLTGCTTKQTTTNTANEVVSPSTEESDGQLTPEEVLAKMDEEAGTNLEQGSIDVEIISPTEEIFSPSQARLYSARTTGLVNGSSCSCDWKFYLNEYDEETLYEEMDNRQCTRENNNESTGESDSVVCGFTSTFIESRGELRVHVDVNVTRKNEIVKTGTAEKMYRVE